MKGYKADDNSWKIICGDSLQTLKQLKDQSVYCCVTSPPYFGLRNYQTDGQIGLEQTPEEYVNKLVAVFREVRRVLRDDGTLWLNLGDSYANDTKWGGSTSGKHTKQVHGNTSIGRNKRITGLKSKDLIGIPWMVAFALRNDGWYLRQDIIWAKGCSGSYKGGSVMPESVTDRCTKSHEYVFLLTKSPRYFFDNEAIKEKSIDPEMYSGRKRRFSSSIVDYDAGYDGHRTQVGLLSLVGKTYPTRNRRSVWVVPPKPFKDAHFATFPPALIRPMILAGCPSRCCPKCGKGWEREIQVERTGKRYIHPKGMVTQTGGKDSHALGSGVSKQVRTLGFHPACDCGESDSVPGVVLDPFGGSGTTAIVALELDRRAILIDLNPTYCKMARNRIIKMPPKMRSPWD